MPNASVAVIGGGIIGCSIAYELSRRGATVHLFDMRDVAQGATQASAGMLVPYLEGHEGGPLLDLGLRSFALYERFVRQVREESGSDVEVSNPGSLQVAADAGAAVHLTEAAAGLRARGISADFLDAVDVRAAEPQLSQTIAGALLVSAHSYVEAGALCAAVARAAAMRGATISRATTVRRIVTAGASLQIETGDRTLEVDTVVLAAGAWSGQIDGVPCAIPVRPVRGQLLHLESNGPAPRRIIWGDECYIVPWKDGSLLVGATVEEAGFDERATTAAVRDLLEAACDLLPSVWQASFRGVRVGLRPASSDGLPLVGRSQRWPGLVYATGHFRNGVLLAPLTAELVAELILEHRSDPALELMSPARLGGL